MEKNLLLTIVHLQRVNKNNYKHYVYVEVRDVKCKFDILNLVIIYNYQIVRSIMVFWTKNIVF